MIDSAHRFHGRASLIYVYRRGKLLRSPKLLLKFALNSRTETYRVAVVVGRKVHKSAVVRNRLRRRVYETVRNLVAPDELAYDLIFTVVDPKLNELSPGDLTDTIADLIKQAGLSIKSQ